MTIFGDADAHRSPSRVDRVARLAGALRGLGVAVGDRVGILVAELRPLPRVLLAVPWAGAVRRTRSTSAGARRRSPTRSTTPDTSVLLRRRHVRRRWSPALRDALPGAARPSSTAATGRPPEGTLRLRGADRRAPSRSPTRDAAATTSGRHLLHRRHHRLPQGRDAQPRQPDRPRRWAALATGDVRDAGRPATCTPRRCSTSPTSPAWTSATLLGRHPRDRPGVHADGGARRRSSEHGVTDALLVPDDDPDARRPPGRRRRRPVAACATLHLRRLADLRGGARARDEARCPNARLHPGLRHDRAGARRHAAAPGRPPATRCSRSAGRAAPHAEVRIVDADDNEVPRGDGRRDRGRAAAT